MAQAAAAVRFSVFSSTTTSLPAVLCYAGPSAPADGVYPLQTSIRILTSGYSGYFGVSGCLPARRSFSVRPPVHWQ